jgi:hypothetical protein
MTKYVKPSVAELGVASDVIQGIGGGKPPFNADDALGTDLPKSSGGAYDLDE